MKKVLILMGRYKPYMSANSICVDNIIKELPKNEYSVTCICYNDYQRTIDEDINVYKVSRGYIKSFLYKYEKPNNLMQKIWIKLLKTLDDFFLLCHIPIWPWTDCLFTKRVYKLADKLHKKNNFDYVIAVHMPISSLIVGKKLKEQDHNIRFIPYFLDSLSGGRPLSIFSYKWNLMKKLKWEKKLLPFADKIIVMESSRMHNESYSATFDYYKKFLYLDVPLLLNTKILESKQNIFKNNKINVVYAGTANYPMRNFAYFVNVVDEIGKLCGDEIIFHIIGQSNCISMFKRSNIKYHPPIVHEQLAEYLNSADILINFGVKTAAAISGKIFEYMSYGKPIISTYSINNEACIPYLKRYPIALLVDENLLDYQCQAKQIIDFINDSVNKSVDINEVRELFRKNLPETFISEVFNNEKEIKD